MSLRRLLAWSGVFAGGGALVKAAYATLMLFLARALSPEAYAGFGLLYAAQTAVTSFAGAGVQEITIGRLKARSHGMDAQVLFRDAMSLFGLSSIFSLAVVAALTAQATASTQLSTMAVVLALVLGAINAIAVLQAALLRLVERHAASLAYSAAVPLLSCAGSAAAYLWRGNVEAVFGGGIAGAVLGLSILMVLQLGYFAFRWRWAELSGEIRALLPFCAIAVFGWFSGYGATFLINALFEPIAVARYTFLMTVAALAQMAAAAMNMAWSPRFYRLRIGNRPAEAEHSNRRFFTLQAYGLGLLAAAATAAVPWAGLLVGGHLASYVSMRAELAMLFAAYVLSVPWWHAQNYFVIENRGAALLRIVAWTGVAGLGAWLAGMLAFGEFGIYVGYLVQVAIRSGVAWRYARKEWGISPPWGAVALGSALSVIGLLVPGPPE